jgi:serpin B
MAHSLIQNLTRHRRVASALAAMIPTGLGALGCSGDSVDSASPGGGVTLTPSPGVERAELVLTAPVEELAAGLNDAGFALWREQPLSDNLTFSPMSIGHALLMARAAADEATGQSIDVAFGLPQGRRAHQAWNTIDQRLADAARAEEDLTITIADRVWPRADVSPDRDWVDLLASEHGASTRTLDFGGDPAGSRDVINRWVGDQTEGLIPELLPAGFLDASTVLVLTDAVYLKARWNTPFGKYPSVTDTFTRLDGSTVEVELMRELELADRRGQGDGFVGAELPYVGGELSMLILVPDAGRFAEIRAGLNQDLLDRVDSTFTTGPYELLMPGWSTNSQLDLLPWLTELGAAPGSYPAITPDAFLSGAVHGADITVDEWGTVAAAATGLAFRESGAPEPELTIKADRPFLYVIRHRDSGLALFAGQVTDPRAP